MIVMPYSYSVEWTNELTIIEYLLNWTEFIMFRTNFETINSV